MQDNVNTVMRKLVLLSLFFITSFSFATTPPVVPEKDKNGWIFLEHRKATNPKESGYGVYVNINHIDEKNPLHVVIPVRLKFDKPSYVYGQDNVLNELALFSWDCNHHTVSVGMFNFWDPSKAVISSIGHVSQYFTPPPNTLFDQIQKYACDSK